MLYKTDKPSIYNISILGTDTGINIQEIANELNNYFSPGLLINPVQTEDDCFSYTIENYKNENKIDVIYTTECKTVHKAFRINNNKSRKTVKIIDVDHNSFTGLVFRNWMNDNRLVPNTNTYIIGLVDGEGLDIDVEDAAKHIIYKKNKNVILYKKEFFSYEKEITDCEELFNIVNSILFPINVTINIDDKHTNSFNVTILKGILELFFECKITNESNLLSHSINIDLIDKKRTIKEKNIKSNIIICDSEETELNIKSQVPLFKKQLFRFDNINLAVSLVEHIAKQLEIKKQINHTTCEIKNKRGDRFHINSFIKEKINTLGFFDDHGNLHKHEDKNKNRNYIFHGTTNYSE